LSDVGDYVKSAGTNYDSVAFKHGGITGQISYQQLDRDTLTQGAGSGQHGTTALDKSFSTLPGVLPGIYIGISGDGYFPAAESSSTYASQSITRISDSSGVARFQIQNGTIFNALHFKRDVSGAATWEASTNFPCV
jgi:hypothetical protein